MNPEPNPATTANAGKVSFFHAVSGGRHGRPLTVGRKAMKCVTALCLLIGCSTFAVCADDSHFVVSFDLPASSPTIEGIAFSDIQVKEEDGAVVPLRPETEEYTFGGHKFIAAIDNGLLGPSNVHKVRVWVYLWDIEQNEWRQIHFAQFERLFTVRSEIDPDSGHLRFLSAANDQYQGTVVCLIDLNFVPKFERSRSAQPRATDNPDDAQ